MPIVDESKGNEKGIELGRALSVDAAIVRVMKARRIISHNALQIEVLTQVSHFKPDSKLIKQRISALIEKAFIERDTLDQTMYRYLP
jgi:hypothetical protein